MKDQLSSYAVGQHQLGTLHYIPDFITEAEEQRLLQEVHASKAKWVQLSGRRLQNHGGIVHTKGLIPAPLPGWLQQLLKALPPQLLGLFPADQPPNHVLINAYQPGCGIMPHEDGPLYHPVVLILSLGSPAVLRFWRKQEAGGTGGQAPVASLLAMPRSLLVFQDDAYTHCLHGIKEVTHEQLDSSVVNAAAAAAAAGAAAGCATSQPPMQVAHQQPQQQLQQQHDCAGGVAAGRSSCDSAVQQSGAGAVCQPEPTQHKHPADQQHGKPGCQADPSSTTLTNGCGSVSSSNGSGSGHDCGGGAACAQAGTSADTPTGGCTVSRQGERVSLTIRRVLKVHKALGILRR